MFTMMLKALLFPLLLFCAANSGARFQKPEENSFREREMVVLECPSKSVNKAKVTWTSSLPQGRDLSGMSSADQRQTGVLVHQRILVILNASVNHQGIYSCSLGNGSIQGRFELTVDTAQSEGQELSKSCTVPESCTLNCPEVKIPPNITRKDLTWSKEGDIIPTSGHFPSIKEEDEGTYICTRSFLYHGRTYNKTFAVELTVKPRKKEKSPVIIEPRNDAEIDVVLGSEVVIDCKALTDSELDGVIWYSGSSMVDRNTSSPVFFNVTRGENDEKIKIKASLVFKKVSEEDLAKNYTCKLDSVSQTSSFVNIKITQKAPPSYVSLASTILALVLIMVVTVVIYSKLKVDITLFFRDTLGFYRRTSDGKRYDAFFMCYKSDTDPGLNTQDRRWLESVLEEKFGYRLCLPDRDVLPGKAIAEAVLDCVEQSRTVILVPMSPDPGLGSGLLSTVHAALVEKQTRLIFIKTESAQDSTSCSMTETLQFLSEAALCVTWKGGSSTLSSSFWKRLRYYLPPLRHGSKSRLLTRTLTQDDQC